MKWTKRITALVLCFFLVSSGPISAFEEAGFFGDDAGQEEPQIELSEGCTECGLLDGHAETCSQYVAPVPEGCAECGLLDGHAETCSQYVAPAPEGCAECGLLESHAEDCSLYVTQEEEESENEISWIPACDCSYAGDAGLSGHTDSCARKSFVRNELIKNYSTEELYQLWDEFDDETQEAVLTFLSWDNWSKYAELSDLLENGPSQGGDEEEEDEELVFSSDDVEGVSLEIVAPEGCFPAGTTAEINSVEPSRSEERAMENALEDFLEDYTVENLGVKMMDITFTHDGEEIQPNGAVYVTFALDEDEIDEDANTLTVFHFDDDGDAEIVANQRLYDLDDISVTIEAYHFSHYAVMTSQTEYKATLLKDYTDFKNQTRYSIVEFPVTLNDFDAEKFNANYNESGLQFTTGDPGVGMNGGNAAATQGIVAVGLKNGFPETNGSDRGAVLFDANTYANSGKTPHDNVKFPFIYDNETGYYTYSSSANHAQYNSSTNTVELYADTMAPYNYLLDVYNQIYADGTLSKQSRPKITVVTPSTTSYMFRYLYRNDIADINTTNYKNFYIRMYSSRGGKIIAQVTYDRSETVEYSLELQQGKWADYVFGDFPSGRTLTQIQFLMPNAKANDYIQYSTAGFLRTNNGSKVNYAGLYPFNVDIKNSYANDAAFSFSTWEERLTSGDVFRLPSSRALYNRELDSENEPALRDTYAYFSMAMEVDFYIPIGGQVDGKDIEFKFNGDDDMWVFVDDQLALDIGGAHIAVEGSINFTTGDTYVENARTLAGTALGEVEGELSPAQYEVGEYHTLKIFYMERGGTASNCLIKFNLPIMPTGNVIVEKTVTEESDCDVPDDLEFTFTATVGGHAHANQPYVLITKDDNGSITEQENKTTNANGQFTLKHNQAASFAGINEDTVVKITETAPTYNGEAYQCTSTTVNGIKGYTATKTTSASAVQSFLFVNTYEAALTDIIIEKTLLGMPESLKDVENQTFLFHVQGDKDNPYTRDIDLTVVINISPDDTGWKDSITIKNVPVGKYTVTEDTNWGWRYEPVPGTPTKYEKREIDLDAKSDKNTFSFKNERKDPYWLSGDCYCENWWNGNHVDEKEKIKDEWKNTYN